MANFHDCFYAMGPSYSVAVTSTATASTPVFGSQTRYLRICHVNSTAGLVVFYATDTTALSSATANGAILPFNWIETIKVSPGQRLYAVQAGGGNSTPLYCTELTD